MAVIHKLNHTATSKSDRIDVKVSIYEKYWFLSNDIAISVLAQVVVAQALYKK